MKLSASLIRQKLKDKFKLNEECRLPERAVWPRPLFYEGREAGASGRLYLALESEVGPEDFRLFPESFFIVFTDAAEMETEGSDNVLEAEGTGNLQRAFNELQKIYDFYEEWEQLLNEALNEERDMQEVLDKSVRVFGNPLTISTSDLSLTAYSSVMEEDDRLRELIQPDNLYEYGTAFMQDTTFRELPEKKEPFYYPEYITGYRNLCMNLFDRGVFRYRIAVPEVLRRFEPGDEELLGVLGSYLQKVLEHQRLDGKENIRTLHSILLQVAENEEKELNQISQELFEYGWLPEHRYVCMNFKVPMVDRQNMSVNFICKHIEALVPSSCAFQSGPDIIVYVNLSRFGGDSEDVFDKLVYFLRDSYLKVGISNEFTGFLYLRYYYLQASAALITGSRKNIYQWIHRFDEIALSYLMEQCTSAMPVKLCCSQKLLILRDYDAEHNTEFYETLRTYLDNHLNAVQSAKELFIHRSTFLYRMDRIKELIGLDMEDKDMLLYLMISYRLLDASGHGGRSEA